MIEHHQNMKCVALLITQDVEIAFFNPYFRPMGRERVEGHGVLHCTIYADNSKIYYQQCCTDGLKIETVVLLDPNRTYRSERYARIGEDIASMRSKSFGIRGRVASRRSTSGPQFIKMRHDMEPLKGAYGQFLPVNHDPSRKKAWR